MNNNFSENIRKIRKENNLSQEQLAEELGVSRQAISKWESGAAYPEMDKIITICKKYNVNIDDLLHNDIKEVKGEEEAKKNINSYIEAFFKFITDSVNLFARMKFGSKLKFLFEQGIIALILIIISNIILTVIMGVLNKSVLEILPNLIHTRIENFFSAVYALLAFVIGIIIMVRIFKVRYLNYYEQLEEGKTDNEQLKLDGNSKIELKKDSKIILRDPKHSDYSFFRGLLKIFIFGVKLAAIWLAIHLCIALVTVGIGFVLSFLVYKTGIFFFGCLLGCVSAGVMLGVVILLLFNFIFNRKNNKKAMIWSFIISLFVMGMSIGMLIVGSLNFDLVDEPKNTKTGTFNIEMQDNYSIGNYNVEYIPEERNDIRVEYVLDEQLTPEYSINNDKTIHFYSYSNNQMEVLRNELKGLNEKKIYPINSDFISIKVYASTTNIEKLKTNYKIYNDRIRNYQEDINNLNEELSEKNQEIEELNERIIELENNQTSEE